MGKTKPIISLGKQEFIVLGLISEKKPIREITKLCKFAQGRVGDCRDKLLEVGFIRHRVKNKENVKGEFRITEDGKWFLNFANKKQADEEIDELIQGELEC